MTWSEMVDLLNQELLALGQTVPSDAPEGAEATQAALAARAARLDQLCERWALTGQWPLMTPLEAWLLGYRLIHARWLAVRLSRPHALGRTIQEPGRPEALHWLLVDSWLPGDPSWRSDADDPSTAHPSDASQHSDDPGLHHAE